VVHPARLERATCGFEVRRSIQLSYGCISRSGVGEGIRTPDNWSHNPGLCQLSYAHHKNDSRTGQVASTGWHGSSQGKWYAQEDSNLRPSA
jgi:hypothetical protein